LDLVDRKGIEKLFSENNFDYVVNLAAQAGVRYSLEHPHAYINSNIVGFLNILEGAGTVILSIWSLLHQVLFTGLIQ
jgi:UDP-glucuronate 4-epimerase